MMMPDLRFLLLLNSVHITRGQRVIQTSALCLRDLRSPGPWSKWCGLDKRDLKLFSDEILFGGLGLSLVPDADVMFI